MSDRHKKGQKAGAVSMLLNFALFVGKMFAGLASNSITIVADSFNSLADCGANVATIMGFRFGAKKADEWHPFGHGRMEYVAGLVVSMIIFATGLKVGIDAVGRILRPEAVEFSWAAAIICVVAILAKIGLAVYLKLANNDIRSKTLDASIVDSISDTLATSVALAALILAPITDWPVDGVLGLGVTVFILVAALRAFGDNMTLLLGQGLKREELRKIRKIISRHEAFGKVERLDVHDYGPESRVLIVMVQLMMAPHSEEFEAEMNDCKQRLCEEFGFEEVIIYWPARVRKPK